MEIQTTIIRLATHFVRVNSRVCEIFPHVYINSFPTEFDEDIFCLSIQK